MIPQIASSTDQIKLNRPELETRPGRLALPYSHKLSQSVMNNTRGIRLAPAWTRTRRPHWRPLDFDQASFRAAPGLSLIDRTGTSARCSDQSRQKVRNRAGDSSVYRTVCWMFL